MGWYFDNQEDSIIINQSALDRGAYNGCKFTYYYDELEDGKERFGIPDLNQTIHTKDGDYTRLTKKGYIPKGSIINKGDIIIGKYSLLPKDYDPRNKYQDKSTVYRSDETAIVHKVVRDRNEDGKHFIKIAIRKLRGVVIGDKFSSRAGQKGIIAMTYPDCDMPCTVDGITPLLIINPHAIPSRINCCASELATVC